MKIFSHIHLVCMLVLGALTSCTYTMEEDQLYVFPKTDDIPTSIFPGDVAEPWQQLVALATTSSYAYDQHRAQRAIGAILKAHTEQYRPDSQEKTPYEQIVFYNKKVALYSLALLHDYCRSHPDSKHPLTHLIAYNAAHKLYKYRNSHEIPDSIDRIKQASGPYAFLTTLYYYFHFRKGERIAYEQTVFECFTPDFVHVFFESNPQWHLLPTTSDEVRKLTDWIYKPDSLSEHLLGLTDQDYPLILKYARDRIIQESIDCYYSPLSRSKKARAYSYLENFLYNNSATAIESFIKINRLNPNHEFKKVTFEIDTNGMVTEKIIANTTPLLIAINRCSPLLVERLLRIGAAPDKRIIRSDGSSITPLELAQSIQDPTYANSIAPQPKAGTEVFYLERDASVVRAQERIIELLMKHMPKPSEKPLIEVTATEGGMREIAGSADQEVGYLMVPAQNLDGVLLRRKNALTTEHRTNSEIGIRVAESTPPPAPPSVDPPQTALDQRYVADCSGCSCGCGASKKNKSKTCAIM